MDHHPESRPDAFASVRDESLGAWKKSGGDGVRILATEHLITRPGAHVLTFWTIDSGLVLQKVVVCTAPPRPDYLGPPQRARGALAK